jgi:hypothetical protein
MVYILVIFILMTVGKARKAVDALSPDTCLELGFETATLSCSTCNTMNTVLGDQHAALVEECNKCCMNHDEDRYAYAVYVTDKRYLFGNDNLRKSLKTLREKYTKKVFDVKNRLGMRPTLKLYHNKEDEEPIESISVYSWEFDTLRDFLQEKMMAGDMDLEIDSEVEIEATA